MSVWNSIILLTVFPMAYKKANEVYGTTRFNSATQTEFRDSALYIYNYFTLLVP